MRQFVLGFALLFMYICLAHSLPILRHHRSFQKTKSKELQNLIEDTLLEIGQADEVPVIPKPVARAANVTAATGAATPSKTNVGSSNQPTASDVLSQAKVAEDRVKGISQKAKEAADKATLQATTKLGSKLYGKSQDSFGDFKGDTSGLFDHDAELALNFGSKNPLVAVDEAEIKRKDIQENPTGAATGGAKDVGTTGATGSVSNNNAATGNANSGVVGSNTVGAQGFF